MRPPNFCKELCVISFFSGFLSFVKNLNRRNVHFRSLNPLMLLCNQPFIAVRGIPFFPLGDFRWLWHGMYNAPFQRWAAQQTVRCNLLLLT